MTTPNTIFLKGLGRHEESVASGTITPGHLLILDSDNKVKAHNVSGGVHERIVATEDVLRGQTIDDDYSAADIVSYRCCVPGDEVLLRLPAGQNVDEGDTLISAGDGTVVKQLLAGGVLYASSADSSEVENTTDETAFDVSYSLPANSVQVGDVLRIRAEVVVIDQNSTDTLTLKLKIGSVTVWTSAAVDVADGDIGYVDVDVIVRTIGATGTIEAVGVQGLGVVGTATAKPFTLAETAIDTTAASTIAVTATWSVAHADNEALLRHLSVELLRKKAQQPVAIVREATDASLAAKPVRTRIL